MQFKFQIRISIYEGGGGGDGCGTELIKVAFLWMDSTSRAHELDLYWV